MNKKNTNTNDDSNNPEEIKKIREEAERLISQINNNQNPHKNAPAKPILQKYSQDNATENSQRQESFGDTLKFSIAFTVLIASTIMVAASLYSNEKKPADTSSGHKKAKKQRESLTSGEQKYYNSIIAKAGNAVLKAEHEAALTDLRSIRKNWAEHEGVNTNTINNLINKAEEKIRFLDQPGKYNYQENSIYGIQWYDKTDPNGFKVFFAHSKTCSNPEVTFTFSKYENGDIAGSYKIKPRSNLSTFTVPYQLEGEQWIKLESVKCN